MDLEPMKGYAIHRALLADAFAACEKFAARVGQVRMAKHLWADFRFFSRDVIDIEPDKEKREQGLLGHLWGAEIHVSSDVENDTIWILASDPNDQEIRQQITMIP